jgi:hypothetical protein
VVSYAWLCSFLVYAAMCWKPGDLRLRPRFICGLYRALVMPYKENKGR